jgi:phosphoribosylaminoimidazole-succinocarboxamide synthase
LSGKNVLFENGSKKVVEHESEDQLIQTFTDNIVTLDGKKDSKVRGKGQINNNIATHLFEYLESYNISTHFVTKLNDRDMQVRRTEIFPVTVLIYNTATTGLKRRYASAKKNELQLPIVEFYHGRERIYDSNATNFEQQALDVASADELQSMSRDGIKINALIVPFFKRRNIDVANIKLQFGKYRNRIILSSEITPDTCQLLDTESGELLSSERFDKDMGNLIESYQQIQERILGVG